MYRTLSNYSAPPVKYPLFRRDSLQVRNNGDAVIPVWHAAALVNGGTHQIENLQVVFDICPARVGDKFWGVVSSTLEPGQCGTMVINGVTPAFIASGYGKYVSPGINGLAAGHSGRAELLYHPTENDRPGILLLGGSTSYDYTGYFKLVHCGGVTFEVINGYAPDDEFCGHTDIPGFEDIPRFKFELPYNAATISLCVFHSRAEGYDVRFTIGEWNAGFTRRAIGNVYADGKIEQAYVAGGEIYFGRDYFL